MPFALLLYLLSRLLYLITDREQFRRCKVNSLFECCNPTLLHLDVPEEPLDLVVVLLLLLQIVFVVVIFFEVRLVVLFLHFKS